MDSPWRGFFARGTFRPGHGPARRVAGRAHARRSHPGARVGEAPLGASLGADSIARCRRRCAGLRLPALSPTLDRPPLAAREPHNLRHAASEPGDRTAALQSGPHRQENGGSGGSAWRCLGDACDERSFRRRCAPGRLDAVYPGGGGRRDGYVGRPAHDWGSAPAGLWSGLAVIPRRDGSSGPGHRADLRCDRAGRGTRRMGWDAPQATGVALLGPLILGVTLAELGVVHLTWPPGVPQAAYLVLGLWVGLLFDGASVKRAGRLFPFVLASAVGLVLACAALGWAFAALTNIDGMTAYLATTPGGIESVAIVALGTGADAPLVLAVQMLRLLAVVFAGSLLGRWWS